MRTTANLIWLRARHESQQNQPAQAFEDLAALLVLSRRVRTDPYVICVLVGYGIQDGTVHFAAEALPQAPPDVLTKFDQQLAALPGGSSMLEGWMGEAASQVEWLRGLEKTDAATLFVPDGKLSKLLLDRTKRPPNFQAAFRQQWENPQSRAAGIAEVQSTTVAAAPVFTVPADQVRPSGGGLGADRSVGRPSVNFFQPSRGGSDCSRTWPRFAWRCSAPRSRSASTAPRA